MAQVEEIIKRALEAGKAFHACDQQKTDEIVRAVFLAGFEARESLAQKAHEETGIGIWQDKALKNLMATQLVYESIQELKTVGVISEDKNLGITEFVEPVGPILALMPVTNPTATTLFKCLIALKTRNPLIISPHNAAKRCIAEAATICYQAALKAGAPQHCIQWLEKAPPQTAKDLMCHPRIALILATGTSSLVRTAQTSGNPVLGVGPGNVPVYMGKTANISAAVKSIVHSKTFDHGTVCASEQAVVVPAELEEKVKREFTADQGYFLEAEQIEKIGRIAFDPQTGKMTATVVGQPVERIALSAGIDVPAGTRLLIAPLGGVGPEYPLSAEILAPILAFYVVDDFEAGVRRCREITDFGGSGHTAVIYTQNEEEIRIFAEKVNGGRILVNTPATHGALGGMFNALEPSLCLASGTGGNNIFSGNISARQLLNIYRICRPRPNPRWERMCRN